MEADEDVSDGIPRTIGSKEDTERDWLDPDDEPTAPMVRDRQSVEVEKVFPAGPSRVVLGLPF